MDTRDLDPIHHANGDSPYPTPTDLEKTLSFHHKLPLGSLSDPSGHFPPDDTLHQTHTLTAAQSSLSEITRQRTDPSNYPEGGLKAWSVVFGSFCGATACFGLMNTIGVLHTYIGDNVLTAYSDGTIGWIFSLYLFISMAGGVICGPIFDRYGPRWMMLIGSIILILGIMLSSLCTRYYQYILGFSLLTGIGTSLVFTPSFAAPGHWFLRRRGLATGIAATGGSVGGTLFPIMLQHLIPSIGFAWSIRVLGFIVLGLSIFSNLLIRSRLPPLPDSNIWPDFKIFRQIPFLLLTIACMLMELSLFVPITYVGTYAKDMGMSIALSYQLITFLNAGSFFGRVLGGFAADSLGRFNTLAFCILICLLSCAALWLPAGSSVAIMVTFTVIFGIASGSNISLIPVCVGQLCRTEEYGRYYSTLYTFVSLGPLIGVPIGGNILQSNGGHYWGLIVFTAAVYGGSMALVITARGLARDWKVTTIF